MDLEKIRGLTIKQKKEILEDLIKNDISYWRKISILMLMVEEDENTELLDLIINHKIEEIELANKKYNLNIKNEEFQNKKDYMDIMEKIITNSNEENYRKACTEVLEVLKHLPQSYIDDINNIFLERLKENSDKNYYFMVDNVVNFSEINLLDESKKILLLISEKFWNKDGVITDINSIFNMKGE